MAKICITSNNFLPVLHLLNLICYDTKLLFFFKNVKLTSLLISRSLYNFIFNENYFQLIIYFIIFCFILILSMFIQFFSIFMLKVFFFFEKNYNFKINSFSSYFDRLRTVAYIKFRRIKLIWLKFKVRYSFDIIFQVFFLFLNKSNNFNIRIVCDTIFVKDTLFRQSKYELLKYLFHF